MNAPPMSWRGHFEALSGRVLDLLEPGEDALLWFNGEQSDFVRFNRGQVRQPGTVEQAEIRVRLECARSLATPTGSPSETVFAKAVSLSQVRGQGEARTGGPERELGDPEGEWASSGS